jgi:hypothetical protein
MRVRGGGRRLFLIAVIAVASVVLLAPAGAAAANVVNGNFETGNLSGWHVHRAVEAGNWFAYAGTSEPIAKERGEALPQGPPQGAFAAITDELSAETLILYQDVALPAGKSEKLSLLAYFNSSKPIAVPPSGTLSVDEGVLEGNANQQYRIDVMKPGAALESVDPGDILRTVFSATPGSRRMQPTLLTADLGAFAGQTVRLRFAVAAREELLTAGVDAVSISSEPPGGGSSPRGSDRIRIGKPKLNRRNGTAVLPVKVPGPGKLSAKGEGLPASGAAGASKTKKLRRLIKPVAVKVAKAGTVKLRLQPTNAARGILELKQKLRVKVAVTYVPTGGSARTATVPVVLKLVARPRRQR